MKKITRRSFVRNVGVSAGALAAAGLAISNSAFAERPDNAFQFSQIKLPYAYNALEPHIDSMTMDIHYNKHHATYIKNINQLITSENIPYQSEKEFFTNASKISVKAKDNAGGSWNHNFFWEMMKPGGSAPSGKLLDAINGSFTSLDEFKKQFSQAALGRFGSGWAWLVSDSGKLKIGSTPNQDNPLMDISELKGTPVLALDVWEHAYYLHYQNKRADYISSWWNVVNWDEAAKRI